MDALAIEGLIGSLKAAADAAAGLIGMKVTAEVQGKVIEIQTALLAAQSSALSATAAQFELQQKVRGLEEQLRRFTDWGAQKQRYSLVNPWRGPTQAYALKRSCAEGETPHLLCPNCFHNSNRVILNPTKRGKFVVLVCPSCKATTDTGYTGIGHAKYAEEYEQGTT